MVEPMGANVRRKVSYGRMSPASPQGAWQREELLHLLSLSGTLAGLCITGVALFHTLGKVAVL
jgi:hypothetical protein